MSKKTYFSPVILGLSDGGDGEGTGGGTGVGPHSDQNQVPGSAKANNILNQQDFQPLGPDLNQNGEIDGLG